MSKGHYQFSNPHSFPLRASGYAFFETRNQFQKRVENAELASMPETKLINYVWKLATGTYSDVKLSIGSSANSPSRSIPFVITECTLHRA